MRNPSCIAAVVALALVGCGGEGAKSVATSRVAPMVRPLDQGGAMGRHGYGAVEDKVGRSPKDLTSQIYGYDVSYYQGSIDFAKLSTVADFVVMRASYGKNSVDAKFATYRAAAEARGMEIGFYHYSYPQLNSAVDEANHFADVVAHLKPGQFVVLDFEESYSGDVVGWCKTWLDTAYARLGVRPLIYLNLSLARGYNWTSVINGNYGLWLARWDYNKTAAAPTTPWPFVAMRQYSDNETVTGISGGNADGDVFYGSANDLLLYGRRFGVAGGHDGPPTDGIRLDP